MKKTEDDCNEKEVVEKVKDEGKIEKLDFASNSVNQKSFDLVNNLGNEEKFPKSVYFIIGNEFCER